MSLVLSGDAPAFSAYRSSAQSFSANTWTKIGFNTEEFDTNSNFDTAASRFTPTVAGYYQINFAQYLTTSVAANFLLAIYKNGSSFKQSFRFASASGYTGNLVGGSCLIYMNGSTDYLEVYANVTQIATVYVNDSAFSYFQGSLVRGA